MRKLHISNMISENYEIDIVCAKNYLVRLESPRQLKYKQRRGEWFMKCVEREQPDIDLTKINWENLEFTLSTKMWSSDVGFINGKNKL